MAMHVDIDSGEILRLLPITDEDLNRRRYIYPGGYVTMGLVNITRLVKADLPADGYRLALLMAVRAVPVTGLVFCSNQEYAKEMGVRPDHISRLIGMLVKCRFIYRVGPKVVMVNPGWCFRGTPAEHHKALEAWAKLNPIGVLTHKTRKMRRTA